MGSRRLTVLITAGLIVVAAVAAMTVLMRGTFVNGWNVAALSFVAALLLFPPLKHPVMRVAGLTTAIPAFLIEATVVTVLSMACFYILNYAFASDREMTVEPAVVEHVYREERHHKRRVGRGRYVNGEVYYVYEAKVKARDKYHTILPLGYTEYSRLRPADTVMVRIRRGFFGFDVVSGKVSI